MKKKIFFGVLFCCVHAFQAYAQDSLKTESGNSFPAGKVKTVVRTKTINGSPQDVFAFMDDIGNTGMHMTKKNAPMMGSKLTVEWLTEYKTGLGATYRWRGKVMGMKMDFTVKVTKWEQGNKKTWETIGEAKMIVLSWYRMFLVLSPAGDGSTKAELGIYYTKPRGSILAFFLARRYAVWCVKSMLRDTKKHFENVHKS